jgi:Zn finger protein HypA/HybF involved in hydrogenase expression
MHDSFLLHKIAASLQRICEDNQISKIKEVVIQVSYNSHIESQDLQEHLTELIPGLMDNSAIVTVKSAEIEDQTAVIYMLKGDGLETE